MFSPRKTQRFLFPLVLTLLCAPLAVRATPANRAAFVRYYGRFLAKRLDNCTTCHLPRADEKPPTSLSEFPHNPFGHRLALLGIELRKAGKKADIPTRLRLIAKEDSDGDGVDNQTELLLGRAPGDRTEKPTATEIAELGPRRADFARFLASYRWEPFDPVRRPAVPKVKNAAWARNPIDAFLAVEHEAHGLRPRPPAPKAILLRRVYFDLIGLSPTPDELRAFEKDPSPNAYEKVVDRLLADPRYGERWGRHWMDVWRYSDWAGWADGGQIRDSQPHIWRWRDWIVESLNKDKGYDRMVTEMLAADELCPEDPDALRATGYLVRNFKLLSREQWLEDTVGHTAKAFLGVTMHCAKCHDHKYDPITQQEYYRLRAVFEPHQVRIDRVSGQPDTTKDGLVRTYDADLKAITYLYPRGDERNPDKTQPMTPGVPTALGGKLEIKPVALSLPAYQPERREFIVKETVEASEKALAEARKAAEAARVDSKIVPEKRVEAEQSAEVAQARHEALSAVLAVEKIEAAGQKDSNTWKQAAQTANAAQRRLAVKEAEYNLLAAKNALAGVKPETPAVSNGKRVKPDPAALQAKVAEAEKALTTAQAELKAAPTTAFKPRIATNFPAESTGRRLAFARWLTDRRNPLTARVAMNQIWMRHFGQGIVPSVADFGRNGRLPSHPQLLDWLAAELMAHNWQMKPLHRLIVTSAAYRMASTPDPTDAKLDPDNIFLWRMASRRMEAEVVRDNALYVAGQLDLTRGGPEIDHNLGLTSRRRSLYLRLAAEKEVEFLKIFDGPSVTECYERKPSVMPQQALALANSELTLRMARETARTLAARVGFDPAKFVTEAFVRVLARRPTAQEQRLCLQFLADSSRKQAAPMPQTTATTPQIAVSAPPTAKAIPTDSTQPAIDPALRARENLVLVLFNHNDFVTIR